MKKYKNSIFIFRRDLRLEDNSGLISALENSNDVLPIFIFDERQVGDKNPYKSDNAIQFMIESLDDLNDALKKRDSKVYFFYGKPEDVIKKLIKEFSIEAVFVNFDYTPFSIQRDKSIESLCNKFNVDFIQEQDLLLNAPDKVLNGSGQPYAIFTAYFKKASQIPVFNPKKNNYKNFFNTRISDSQNLDVLRKKILPDFNKDIWVHGGRSNGLKLLNGIKNLKDYKNTRDFPYIDTSNLSAHNKFGTISIREFYHKIKEELGAKHLLIQQLYWRDFFTVVAYFYPYVFGKPYNKKYNELDWIGSQKLFEAWKNGQTGFPIVDAGIRQLNSTGFMHNRVRMIVGSFLVKDLHINWLEGEKYFAQKLVDYDPCVNNGNWQWVASTGCDAAPYFRIFNPWLQQKKFDPGCEYIKKWIPELKVLDAKEIHNWYKSDKFLKKYPKPIVDHDKESKETKKLYKKSLG